MGANSGRYQEESDVSINIRRVGGITDGYHRRKQVSCGSTLLSFIVSSAASSFVTSWSSLIRLRPVWGRSRTMWLDNVTYQHLPTSTSNYRKKESSSTFVQTSHRPLREIERKSSVETWRIALILIHWNEDTRTSTIDRDVQRTTKNSIKDEVSAEKISHSWYGHIHEVQSHGRKSNQLVKLPHEQSTMPIPNGLIVQVTCRLFGMFVRPWPFSMFLTDLQPRMNFNVGSMCSVRVTSSFLIVADGNLYITIA